MRKAAKQIAVCAFALLLLCAACRLLPFSRFSIYIRTDQTEQIRITVEKPDVLRAGEAEIFPGFVRIPVYAQGPGTSALSFSTGNNDNELVFFHMMRVDSLGTVYDMNTGNFTGDTAVLIAVTLFWLLVGLTMFRATASHLIHPETYSMYAAYSSISEAGTRYMMMTAPAMILFAIAVAVSNIALLRHGHRPRPQNALGLLISLLLLTGEAVGIYLWCRDFMGSEWQGRIDNTIRNTFCTAFIYCQCMLTGAVICGITAARRIPAPDKDFILILGCWFRQDGSLPPLLKGRADKALEFWNTQKEETGKEAFFIPSGGQGQDEPMPEAEAIRRYLLSRDIDERLILPETSSVNTLQNMIHSREIIGKTGREGKTLFATSSYHVFRSGLLARQAGLSAEGIGSRTKWWFWPNAFLRETAGLLQKRWKQELCLLVLMTVFFGALSMLL